MFLLLCCSSAAWNIYLQVTILFNVWTVGRMMKVLMKTIKDQFSLHPVEKTEAEKYIFLSLQHLKSEQPYQPDSITEIKSNSAQTDQNIHGILLDCTFSDKVSLDDIPLKCKLFSSILYVDLFVAFLWMKLYHQLKHLKSNLLSPPTSSQLKKSTFDQTDPDNLKNSAL